MKAKKKLPLFDKLVLLLNCGIALALLISYLAPVTDPRKYWVIAFFGLAYPPVLLFNVLLIVYWLFRKSWYALVSVLCILIGINVLQNNIGFNWDSDSERLMDVNAFRLMTYNVHNFKKFSNGRDTSTKTEILTLIKHQSPDVIGIQEFFTRKRGRFAMTDSIKKGLGFKHYYFENIIGNTDETIGMAIFSKFPITNTGFIPLSEASSENQCIYVDIKKAKHIFRVYSVHLQSIKFKSEDYRYLDTVTQSGRTDMSSTRRLGGKLKRAFIRRAEQVFTIKEHTKTCPYPYIIVGDFNDTPTSFAVSQMSKGLNNAFRNKGVGLGRTYNGDFPNYQIDYVLASNHFDVRSYRIIEKKLSDHYPIVTDLVLK
jgi:endonuclease/exonuclease/phosphatase family metal-dependent hydrolase